MSLAIQCFISSQSILCHFAELFGGEKKKDVESGSRLLSMNLGSIDVNNGNSRSFKKKWQHNQISNCTSIVFKPGIVPQTKANLP